MSKFMIRHRGQGRIEFPDTTKDADRIIGVLTAIYHVMDENKDILLRIEEKTKKKEHTYGNGSLGAPRKGPFE